MTPIIGVYGAAGCGRGIMPLVRLQYPTALHVFIDDMPASGSVNGHDVMNWDEFVYLPVEAKFVSIAIANPAIRKRIADKCEHTNIPLIEARASSAIEMDDVIIGDGACLSPFVTLTSNIRIGRCLHANLYSYIEHDAQVGNFVTLAPGAKINGNVTIGDFAYIGAGAVIRQGLSIGSGATIGMGAVVTRDVPPGATVVGNPAKTLIKE